MNMHTFDVRHLMAGAQSEARQLGHRFVGTEHVLLAVISDPPAGARRCPNNRKLAT